MLREPHRKNRPSVFAVPLVGFGSRRKGAGTLALVIGIVDDAGHMHHAPLLRCLLHLGMVCGIAVRHLKVISLAVKVVVEGRVCGSADAAVIQVNVNILFDGFRHVLCVNDRRAVLAILHRAGFDPVLEIIDVVLLDAKVDQLWMRWVASQV